MNNTATLEKYETLTSEQLAVEQLPVSRKRTLPSLPFPRKYVLSTFLELQNAKQAAHALLAAGFDERDTHVLQSFDVVDAVAQEQSPINLTTSMDYDIYLREASRGRSFLAVRPANYAQLKQIRDLLAPHGAYLARYINTWTVTELLA